jgi:hypothetical protein
VDVVRGSGAYAPFHRYVILRLAEGADSTGAAGRVGADLSFHLRWFCQDHILFWPGKGAHFVPAFRLLLQEEGSEPELDGLLQNALSADRFIARVLTVHASRYTRDRQFPLADSLYGIWIGIGGPFAATAARATAPLVQGGQMDRMTRALEEAIREAPDPQGLLELRLRHQLRVYSTALTYCAEECSLTFESVREVLLESLEDIEELRDSTGQGSMDLEPLLEDIDRIVQETGDAALVSTAQALLESIASSR